MQFYNIGYDENSIISFSLEENGERYYNPFLIAQQAMIGNLILEDYHENSGNLIPDYFSLEELLQNEIDDEMNYALEWLKRHAIKEGKKYYWDYDYPVIYGVQNYMPGWRSAYAQAYVILAMTFHYKKTNDDIYKKYAIGAINGLVENMKKGGCTNYINRNEVWFEEIPGKDATHIFNAHIISIIAILKASYYLNLEDYNIIVRKAINALEKKIELMDTGTMSAYDMPSSIDFQLQLDSESYDKGIYFGSFSIRSGLQKKTIDLKKNECFNVSDTYATGVDWSSEFDQNGFRKVVCGRDIREHRIKGGALQNTFLVFKNINTKSKFLKMTIEYSSKEDIALQIRKNCGESGFNDLGYCENILLSKDKNKIKIDVPTQVLYTDTSLIYHSYHIKILEELTKVCHSDIIESKLKIFKHYVEDKRAIVYYTGNTCNPFVRSIIRSILMLKSLYVDFIKSDKNVLVAEHNETKLDDLLAELSRHENYKKILNNNIIMDMLGTLVGREYDASRPLIAVMHYLYMEKEIRQEDIMYINMWESIYGEKESFKLKNNTEVNLVNRNETSTYLKLFEKQKEEGKYIENATVTLLDTIPCDVDTIADIGSGPGLVNRHIPFYYDVLAIDINEDILAQNTRKTCLGDILDIPLANASVDMMMACDVLEHIEKDKIDLAVNELKRVSKKYIYLQVPHNEILRYGIAKCPCCKNIWHVNFHKNTFRLEELQKYEDDLWHIKRVNYTGFVENEHEFFQVYEHIEKNALKIYRVEGFECPKCGTQSRSENVELLKQLEKEAVEHEKCREIIPKYTEIGVLFEKRTEEKEENYSLTNKETGEIYQNNIMEFDRKVPIKDIYTGREQIPFILMNNANVEKQERSIIIKKSEGEILNFAIYFPFKLQGLDIIINGKCEKENKLSIWQMSEEMGELKVDEIDLEEGEFSYKFRMPSNQKYDSRIFRVYSEENVSLYNVRVECEDFKEYIFLTQQELESEHYSVMKRDIQYSYFIPEEGVAFRKQDDLFVIC